MKYYLTQEQDYIGVHSTDGEIPDGLNHKEITEAEYNDYVNSVSAPAYYRNSEDVWVERQTWSVDAPTFEEETDYTLATPACTSLILNGAIVDSVILHYDLPGIYKIKIEPFPEYMPLDITCTVTANLDNEISRKVKELEQITQDYIKSKIIVDVQQWLKVALLNDRTTLEQKIKIKNAFEWINAVLHYMYGIRDQYENGSFVDYDFSQFDEKLPDITLRDCLPSPISLPNGKGDDSRIGF